MESNYWEERDMNKMVQSFHEKTMSNVKLPQWLSQMVCPFCKNKLPLRSIRNIQFCFNARNFGDIAVELFCDDCRKMDTIYYREGLECIQDFIDILNGKAPKSEPLIEELMSNALYNNIMDKMIKDNKVRLQGEIDDNH